MSKTQSRILFLARWYPDRYDPMKGLFIKRHAEVAAGFSEVAVLYLGAAPDKAAGLEIVQETENGVFAVKVYYGTKNSLPAFFAKPFAALLYVLAFCKGYSYLRKNGHQPDIIHVNVLTRMGLFALWLRWFGGIRYVITEHWSRYLPVTGTYKGLLRRFFTKMVVRYAAAVSTVSENLATAMQGHGLLHPHYMVLPNVVDTEAYTPATVKTGGTLKRFIHISCFEDRSKNISGLLRVLARLAATRNDFECIMVGDGMDYEAMKDLATQHKLSPGHVRFTGLLQNGEVVSAYRQAEFLVMFSNYENMPVVISEALSCGLPVIATAVGGIPEYVNMQNGRLVPAGDETALFDAILFMLDHSKDFDQQGIRQHALAAFSKPAVASKLRQLYAFVNI